MRAAGLSIAVQNSRADVTKEAHYISRTRVETAPSEEFLLKAQGKWKKIGEAYIGERSPEKIEQ